MVSAKKWYAVYTKPRCEKKVAELLTRKDIENYCPLSRVHRQWSDRKKVIDQPLFQSYVFVHLNELELTTVRNTNGVLNYIYWLGKPAVIRDEEINIIKRFLNDYDDVILEKCEVNINDTIRINSGPFLFEECKVIQVLHNTVKVLLPSLGFALTAEIRKTNVEVIVKTRSFSYSK